MRVRLTVVFRPQRVRLRQQLVREASLSAAPIQIGAFERNVKSNLQDYFHHLSSCRAEFAFSLRCSFSRSRKTELEAADRTARG